MPLIRGKSKKAFQEDMQNESGKPQDLAISYGAKRAVAKKKMAKGGMVEKLQRDPNYAEGGMIDHESSEEQAHDDIDDPKEHEADASHVGLMIEHMEHPDVAGMVMKIMKDKKAQMMMSEGGDVPPSQLSKDARMYALQKGATGKGEASDPKETMDYKIKKFFGANPQAGYAEGGEIPEPSRSRQPDLGFEDSDHEDDDFLSQDDYMNEYMDHEEDAEVKKKKMLSGIMASIAAENYGRNK